MSNPCLLFYILDLAQVGRGRVRGQFGHPHVPQEEAGEAAGAVVVGVVSPFLSNLYILKVGKAMCLLVSFAHQAETPDSAVFRMVSYPPSP